MSSMFMYSVLDRVAKAHLDPFYAPNDDFARRVFSNACRDKGHPFGRNPEDYALFKVGQFTQANGQVIPCEPERIYTGTEAAAVSASS